MYAIRSYYGWSVEVGSEKIPFDERSFSFVSPTGQTIKIDLCIVYIHGNPGENGKVQAYLDMIGMPYVNSGALASELSFDKWYCNQFLKGFGIKVAKSIYLRSADGFTDENAVISELGLPVFVKPCDSGSSYGIAKVKSTDELKPAIEYAFNEGRTVVVA